MTRKDRRRKSGALRRPSPSFHGRPSLLVVCEGTETEPRYFKALRQELRLSTLQVEIARSGGSAPIRVVDEALDQRTRREREAATDPTKLPFDEIWCVFDVDQHSSLDQALDKARAHQLSVILSNPCFEFWFLLHFEQTGQAFLHCKRLVEHLGKKHLPGYDKGADVFDQLNPHKELAIRRSKSLFRQQWQHENDLRRCNPCTQVHRLVERLQKIASP
jgi:hypothetical protein